MLKFCSKVKKVLNSAGNVKSAERYRDMPNNSCFQFPLGVTVVPREIEDNGYAKFGGWGGGERGGKQGLCENGEWTISEFPRGIFTREVVYLASF